MDVPRLVERRSPLICPARTCEATSARRSSLRRVFSSKREGISKEEGRSKEEEGSTNQSSAPRLVSQSPDSSFFCNALIKPPKAGHRLLQRTFIRSTSS